jgi:hypothetical protein
MQNASHTRNPWKALRSFHEDEDGLETLQVVMIIAVAAIALIAVKTFWEDIKEWAEKMIEDAVGWD